MSPQAKHSWSERQLLNLPSLDRAFQVRTRSVEFVSNASNAWPHHWILDLAIEGGDEPKISRQEGRQSLIHAPNDPSRFPNPSTFLRESLDLSFLDENCTIVRFVFSCEPGYVIRSDFLAQRLECCDGTERVVSFLPPLGSVHALPYQQVSPGHLEDVLVHSIGALLVRGVRHKDIEHRVSQLDHEFSNRFSFPWLQLDPIPRRRIAWVQGRENIGVSQRAYEAARAMGFSIVMIENPGHWFEDDKGPYAYLRESFIATSIEVDDGFTQRIVDAVRSYKYPVEGLMTISDLRLPGVAKACEILGLPTSPHMAYQNAGDKARTRRLEDDAGESVTLANATELNVLLNSEQSQNLSFPLVVKPALGWNSDCVTRVSSREELVEAVQRASGRHAEAANPSLGVVIEPYIDGPEVDANLVLLDGEVVYFDIEDDFPTRGDAEHAAPTDNFQETQVVVPSALPQDEIELLRDSLHRSIIRQGFTSGVFHCEARIRNSAVIYKYRDGILDMEKKPDPTAQTKSVYLHEINARPPGYLESVAAKLAHGVDYYALRILLSIGSSERSRIHALANSFLNGPQFHLCILIIPQTRAGIMKTEDAGADLLERYPDLRKCVPDYDTYLKKGAVLEGPTARSLWWIANFSVISRTSRLDCLQRARFIQDNFEYELE